MKKRTFMFVFVGIQLALVLLQIDKQGRLIKLSYQKQRAEQILATLKIKKQELLATVHSLQNHQKIKQYAQSHLGMEPLSLKKIKKLSHEEGPQDEHPVQS